MHRKLRIETALRDYSFIALRALSLSLINLMHFFLQDAPALPKTRSGKIMRRILRKIAADDKDLGIYFDKSIF